MQTFITDLSRKNILVVEDDICIRETMKEILENEGYAVETATDGQDGLYKVGLLRPSLILLDMRMPIMGGREFLEQIQKDSSLAEIPVLVVSATAKNDTTYGARGLIKKPIDLNHLLDMVETHTMQ